MSTVTETVSNFVSIVMAKLQGDDAKVLALRNEKRAKAALKGQISALQSEQVNLEVKLEDAVEAHENAKYPTKDIVSSESYIDKVASTYRAKVQAEENLEENKESIEFYEGILAGL